MRVKDKCGAGALMLQPEEEMIDQGSFPGPSFSGQQHQALAAFQGVSQFIQGAPRLRRQVKIRRVRIYVERVLLKPEKTLVHEWITQKRSTLGPGDLGWVNRDHTLP
jgi:hypothetical protein